MEPLKCIDVCYEVLKMILAAGEDYHGLCEQDKSGLNHRELLHRLKKYELVELRGFRECDKPKLLE